MGRSQEQAGRPKAPHKEVEAILAEAEVQGFCVEPGKGRTAHHFRVYRVQGGRREWVTNFPSTPGNNARRSILNSLAPLKRAGFQPRSR